MKHTTTGFDSNRACSISLPLKQRLILMKGIDRMKLFNFFLIHFVKIKIAKIFDLVLEYLSNILIR